MCAIMNKLRVINAAARHRLVFDLRIPVLLYPGAACPAVALAKADAPAVARREIGPMVFNSRLTQPLFTRLGVYDKTRSAPTRSRAAVDCIPPASPRNCQAITFRKS